MAAGEASARRSRTGLWPGGCNGRGYGRGRVTCGSPRLFEEPLRVAAGLQPESYSDGGPQ
eukprot:5598175-Pyramimonas_sp.AAC.1